MQFFLSVSKCGCLLSTCASPLLPGLKAEVTKCHAIDNLPKTDNMKESQKYWQTSEKTAALTRFWLDLCRCKRIK